MGTSSSKAASVSSAPLISADQESQKVVNSLWVGLKAKVGKLFGKDVCKLGSPYMIAVALIAIGFLSSMRILPFGSFGFQFTVIGHLLFVIAVIRSSEHHQTKVFAQALPNIHDDHDE